LLVVEHIGQPDDKLTMNKTKSVFGTTISQAKSVFLTKLQKVYCMGVSLKYYGLKT
jgi:hypothetical protein